MRHRSGHRRRSFSAIAIVLMTLWLFGGLFASGQDSLPGFVYPNEPSSPRLRLVSLFSDPGGKEFVQYRAVDRRGLNQPTRVISSGDNIYVLDAWKGKVFKSEYRDNTLTSYRELPKGDRAFHSATDITLDDRGRLWLVDSRLKMVFVIDSSGKVIDSVSGEFHRPVGVLYHPALRSVLLSDLGLNTVYVISADSELEVRQSFSDTLTMQGPSAMALGPRDQLYVCNALSGEISVYNRQFEFIRSFGGFGDGPGSFARPKGIAVDSDGLIYVSDALFDNVQIFNPDQELLLALGYTGSGPGEFSQPQDVTIGSNGLVYVADSFNKRLQVFRWER